MLSASLLPDAKRRIQILLGCLIELDHIYISLVFSSLVQQSVSTYSLAVVFISRSISTAAKALAVFCVQIPFSPKGECKSTVFHTDFITIFMSVNRNRVHECCECLFLRKNVHCLRMPRNGGHHQTRAIIPQARDMSRGIAGRFSTPGQIRVMLLTTLILHNFQQRSSRALLKPVIDRSVWVRN